MSNSVIEDKVRYMGAAISIVLGVLSPLKPAFMRLPAWCERIDQLSKSRLNTFRGLRYPLNAYNIYYKNIYGDLSK